MKYFISVFSCEKGELSLIVIVTLSIIASLGLLAVRGPEALDKYNQSLGNVRNGEPTNQDMYATRDAVQSLADAGGGLPIPTGVEDVIQIAATSQMTSMVEMASRPIPEDSQGYGSQFQSAACGISVDKKSAEPGEFVQATITIPKPFQSKISHITGEAGNDGFSLGNTGGTHSFSMPSVSADSIKVIFDAYATNGTVACKGAATVAVTRVQLPCESTAAPRIDIFVQAKVKGPANAGLTYWYKKKYCNGTFGTTVGPYTGTIGSNGIYFAGMLGSFKMENSQDQIQVFAIVNGQEKQQVLNYNSFGMDGFSIFFPKVAEFSFP
jgi:hypothetical protein